MAEVFRAGDEPPAPPNNVEAEAALLGALMIDNRLVDRVAAIVQPAHFYEPLHARIYKIILKFAEQGRLANPVTLRPIFEQDRAMKEVGGPAYLAQLTGSGAAVIGSLDFAAQIRELAMLRRVIGTLEDWPNILETEGGTESFFAEVDIAVAEASQSLETILVRSAEDMVGLMEDRANRAIEQGIPGASCRLIPDIDTLIGKLEPGQMTIIAGRPGMGKSTLAVSAAWGYALNSEPGLYALAESSAEMFAIKMTADLLHAAGRAITFKTLKEGLLSNAERRDVERAREVAKQLPLRFAHIGRTDIRRLEAIVARETSRLKREGKRLSFVIVDYLQLLTADGRHRVGDDRGRVNAVSEGLLAMAQKYQTHVIALSQLSRGVEQREDKRPRLSDLRESGRLEEDADNVVLLYREEYYLDRDPRKDDPKRREEWEVDLGHSRGKVELIAAKTRFGANAARKCQFLGEYSAIRGSAFRGSFDPYSDEPGDDLFSNWTGSEE